MYYYEHPEDERQQQPSVMYLPPVVIQQYMNQWIQTTIPGYGRVVAYVLDFNERTGMVSLFIYVPPRNRGQYIQVHYSDLIGIAPYFGPIPPRPRPRPPFGGGPGPGPGGGGGGFFPWFISGLF